jgi:hypothetical protein
MQLQRKSILKSPQPPLSKGETEGMAPIDFIFSFEPALRFQPLNPPEAETAEP